MTVLACVVYGIVHDQITARICVEYFTIGHAPIFGTKDPTLLGIGWGVVATWWFGVLLGIPLAVAGRAGIRRQRTCSSLVRPMIVLLVCTGCLAALAGCVGFVAATNGWVVMPQFLADRVPAEKHIPFLIDLWIHNASYLGGAVFGGGWIAWVWYSRPRIENLDENAE